MRRRRRRSRIRNIFSSIRGFFSRHLKGVLVVLLLAFVVLLVILIVRLFNGISNNAFVGQPGIAKMEQQNIGVFDTKKEAEEHPLQNVEGLKDFHVNGDNAELHVTNFLSAAKVNSNGNGNFTVDFSNVGNGSIITLETRSGGDGSLVGKAFHEDVEVHYFAVQVKNSNPNVSTVPNVSPSGPKELPTGQIYFGQDRYTTYGTETDAQASATFSVPSYMARNMTITAVPSENTSRIRIKPCMLDSQDLNTGSICVSSDTNWSGTLDLSEYAGHQVTLMIKAEDSMALTVSYQYVSFWVPVLD